MICVGKLLEARMRTITRKHRIVARADDKNWLLYGSENAVFRVFRRAPRDKSFCLSLEYLLRAFGVAVYDASCGALQERAAGGLACVRGRKEQWQSDVFGTL